MSTITYQTRVIKFKNNNPRILVQNDATSCPLIAVVNALCLKRAIFLSETVYSLNTLQQLLNTLLENIEILSKGLLIDPRFDIPFEFMPSAQLDLLKSFGIPIYHAWVVDPQDTATLEIVKTVKSFDEFQIYICELQNGKGKQIDLGHEETAIGFLDSTRSQMTLYGLISLYEKLTVDSVSIFFR